MSSATADAPSTALARPVSQELTTPRGFVQLTTLKEAREFAELLCSSDMVPKDYKGKDKVGNAIVAMQMGLEIGLPPLQAIQGIAVINGRPAIWGDALRALILSAPDLEDLQEKDDGTTATCVIKRRGRSPVTGSFSQAEAQLAGLAGGNVWKAYPRRMRQNRAFAFAARDAFADRLKGLASADELGDVPETPISEPKRVGSSSTVAPAPESLPESAATPATPGQSASPPASSTAAPPPTTTSAPASTAAPANGAPQQTSRRVQLLNTAYVAAAGSKKEYWKVQTSDGEFVTGDEQLAKTVETCLGTDHRFMLTWKLTKTSAGGTARLLLQLDSDDDETGGAS